MPARTPHEDPTYEEMFKFLFPTFVQANCQPRYVLYPPDLVELRWSVYDTFNKLTVSFGLTSVAAVQAAMEHVHNPQLPLT